MIQFIVMSISFLNDAAVIEVVGGTFIDLSSIISLEGMVKASSVLCVVSALVSLVIAVKFFLISKKYERAHIPVQVMNIMIVAFIC
jgi:hypothetical protein